MTRRHCWHCGGFVPLDAPTTDLGPECPPDKGHNSTAARVRAQNAYHDAMMGWD